jgi:hypothetical protein
MASRYNRARDTRDGMREAWHFSGIRVTRNVEMKETGTFYQRKYAVSIFQQTSTFSNWSLSFALILGL